MNRSGQWLRFWPWLAAILSGLLCIACFAPFKLTWLCWIALTPLVCAVWFSGQNSKRRWLRNLLLGYVAGIVFFTGAFSWLGSLGILYESIPLRGLSLLLSIYLGLYFAFWAWFIGSLRPRDFLGSTRNLLTAFLAASAWVAEEWIRGWLFTGFGWNGLGVALCDYLALIQIAEITGVAGLSFVVVFANITAVAVPIRIFREAQAHHMRPHFDFTLPLVGLLGLFAFGIHVAAIPKSMVLQKSLRVAAVQTNVPQVEKADPRFASESSSKLIRLSEIALRSSPSPEVVIWPESALPNAGADADTPLLRRFFALTSSETDLIFGADDSEDGRAYNAAFLLSKRGEQVQTYRKIHLVPFGEYIPLRHSFPLFAQIAGRWVPGDFDRGKEHTVFQLTGSEVRVAPLICFEDTVGDLTRHFVLNGANLLVNVTNDGWFLYSAGSHQHLDNAVFRCIETRRPMVRAANTGVTCFVNEFGRTTQILQGDNGSTFTEGVLNGEINVPQDQRLTFYVRHGEVFAQACAGITVIAVIILISMSRGRRD